MVEGDERVTGDHDTPVGQVDGAVSLGVVGGEDSDRVSRHVEGLTVTERDERGHMLGFEPTGSDGVEREPEHVRSPGLAQLPEGYDLLDLATGDRDFIGVTVHGNVVVTSQALGGACVVGMTVGEHQRVNVREGSTDLRHRGIDEIAVLRVAAVDHGEFGAIDHEYEVRARPLDKKHSAGDFFDIHAIPPDKAGYTKRGR